MGTTDRFRPEMIVLPGLRCSALDHLHEVGRDSDPEGPVLGEGVARASERSTRPTPAP